MSAQALMQWLAERDPDVVRLVRGLSCPPDFYDFMQGVTGVKRSAWQSHDELCAAYLDVLKSRSLCAPRTVKAPPQLPPEIWQTRPVDAELAMASVRDMSRGGA